MDYRRYHINISSADESLDLLLNPSQRNENHLNPSWNDSTEMMQGRDYNNLVYDIGLVSSNLWSIG